MDKDLPSDLSPDQLADLLAIAFDTSSNRTEDAEAHTDDQLIEAHLVGTLALDTTVLNNLPTVVAQLDKDIFGGGGQTLGNVLTDPGSNMETIKKIKRYAKNISLQQNPKNERTVALAIYYAAIANALLFHRLKITAHSDETIKAQFRKFAAKSWMPKELAYMFAETVKAMEASPE